MFKVRRSVCAAVVMAAALLSAPPAGAAPVEAIAITDGFARDHFTGLSIGFEFTPTVDISVTHLGTYDRGNDGLAQEHETGIYINDGTEVLQGSVVIPSGTSAPSIGSNPNGAFRYQPVTPFTLEAGQSYFAVTFVAGNSPDLWLAGSYTGRLDDPSIDIGAGTYAEYVATMAYPRLPAGADPWLGPNFRFEVVPEPASLGALGLIGTLFARRRRSR